MALFRDNFRRDSIFLVFSCEMLLVSHLKRPLSCISVHIFLVISFLLILDLSICFLLDLLSLPPRFIIIIFDLFCFSISLSSLYRIRIRVIPNILFLMNSIHKKFYIVHCIYIHIYIYIYIYNAHTHTLIYIFTWPLLSLARYYLPTPPLGHDMTQGQFLSGV